MKFPHNTLFCVGQKGLCRASREFVMTGQWTAIIEREDGTLVAGNLCRSRFAI